MISLPEALAAALEHHRAGQLQAAEQIYRQILDVDPAQADVWHLLGVLSHQAGQHLVAVDYIRHAVTLNPENHIYYSNLGEVFHILGQFDEGIAAFEKCIQLVADYAPAHAGLGILLKNQGHLERARPCYETAIRLEPRGVAAYNNLANLLREMGFLRESEQNLRRAIELDPKFADAYCNLGAVLCQLGRFDEAFDNLNLALQLKPNLSAAHINLGAVLLDLGQLEAAIAQCRRALQSAPASAEAHANLAQAWQQAGLLAEAESSYRTVLSLAPGNARISSGFLMLLNYLPQSTAEELFREHKKWAAINAPPTVEQEIPQGVNSAADFGDEPARRLRVAYISPDLRWHPVAGFVEPLLRYHRPDRLEVIVYADVGRPDDVTRRLQAMAPIWHDISGLSEEQVLRQIRGDGIDLLVDLAGHSARSRLGVFGRRAAAIQVSYLGYPNTTGLDAMDFLLTDSILDPPGSDIYYSERLVRLQPGFS